jgi:hypothetical protein
MSNTASSPNTPRDSPPLGGLVDLACYYLVEQGLQDHETKLTDYLSADWQLGPAVLGPGASASRFSLVPPRSSGHGTAAVAGQHLGLGVFVAVLFVVAAVTSGHRRRIICCRYHLGRTASPCTALPVSIPRFVEERAPLGVASDDAPTRRGPSLNCVRFALRSIRNSKLGYPGVFLHCLRSLAWGRDYSPGKGLQQPRSLGSRSAFLPTGVLCVFSRSR